eukprot:181885-Amphidinium_carterae.1
MDNHSRPKVHIVPNAVSLVWSCSWHWSLPCEVVAAAKSISTLIRQQSFSQHTAQVEISCTNDLKSSRSSADERGLEILCKIQCVDAYYSQCFSGPPGLYGLSGSNSTQADCQNLS